MNKSTVTKLTEDKVVCPHCWNRFYRDQALYISEHPELRGHDEVLGKEGGLPDRVPSHETRQDRDGNVLDSYGWKMTDRACPTCHLQIPRQLLQKRPTFVSIAGAPGSGKSYLLTSMLHQLRTELPSHFGLTFKEADSDEVLTFIRKYEDVLYYPDDPEVPARLQKTEEAGQWYNKVKLDGGIVTLPKPFVFSIATTDTHLVARRKGTRRHQSIVLYDNAGESFNFMKERGSQGQIRATHHLAESDAVLFVFDPLQDKSVRDRLSTDPRVDVSDPQLTPNPHAGKERVRVRQDTVLTEVVSRIRRHTGVVEGKRLSQPLAICVQKYDVWRHLVRRSGICPDGSEIEVIDQDSFHHSKGLGISGLDVEELNAISLLVRQFLVDTCPSIVTMAEAEFSIVRYFPVSALGTSPFKKPGDQEYLYVRPSEIAPFRVTDPVLWLLYHQHGLIFRKKADATGAGKYPHAVVKRSQTPGRVEIVFPPSQTRLIVDDQYAGSSVAEPENGHFFWVPEVESVRPVEPPHRENSPSIPTAPTTGVTLQLSDEPTETKRRWFRRGK